jgi:serine/threonine-protein kinase
VTDPVVAQGAVLAGKYRVERVLGQGGMGVVVQATHLQLGQPVAMKFLRPEVLGKPQVVQRFLREAQAVVQLKSEHVARVIDVGALDTGAPYMVLEYLEGADLARGPRSQLTVGGIVDLVLQACEALAEAHALGIVHRDLKPANLFLTRRADGTPLLKVLDFGISKIAAASGPLTATQVVMGTPAYMSPEQMRSSRRVDHRSDIWSLGVVLYELLQGAPPFRDDEFSAMVLKVVNDPLPRLTVPLPGDLDQILYRCLEKDPARRFPDVAELARALATYAGSETQAAISMQRTRGVIGAEPARAVLAPATASRPAPSTLSGSAGERTMRLRGGRRWPVAAAMGALAGGIVIAVIAANGPGRTEPPRPSARPDGELHTVSPPGPGTTMPPSRLPIATTPSPPAATAPSSPPTSIPASTPPSSAATAPPSPAVPVATAPGPLSAPSAPSHLTTPRSIPAPASTVATTPSASPPAASSGHAVTAEPRTIAAKPSEIARRSASPAAPTATPKSSPSPEEPAPPIAPVAFPPAKPEAAPPPAAAPSAKLGVRPASSPTPPDDDVLGARK